MRAFTQFGRSVGLALGLVAFSVVAFGQRPGGSTPGGAAGTPGGSTGGALGGSTGGRNTPGSLSGPTTTGGVGQRPTFLSGKVMMDDGTAPPQSVTIERVCNSGIGRAQTYTDSKGRFSFQLGNQIGVLEDASVARMDDPRGGGLGSQGRSPGGSRSGGDTGMSLVGCELRAVMPGYRSDTVSLSDHRSFDTPEVGTIVLHRLTNVLGTTVSMTTLQAPKEAKKAYEKASEALRRNKPAEGEKLLEKAVEIYPNFAAAWFELGQLQDKQNASDEARKSYQRAIQADSKYVSPYVGLATQAFRSQNWPEVAEQTAKIVKLNPVELPQAYYFQAVANYNLKNLSAAEDSAREAQKLDTGHRLPKNDQLLGVILAQKQDYKGAVENIRSYLKFAPEAQDATEVKGQLAELEKLAAEPQAKQ